MAGEEYPVGRQWGEGRRRFCRRGEGGEKGEKNKEDKEKKEMGEKNIPKNRDGIFSVSI